MALLDIQRKIIFESKSDIVLVAGRDIGSKILGSKADLKLFFTCSSKTKAKRRFKEFRAHNKKITLNQKIRKFQKKIKEENLDRLY